MADGDVRSMRWRDLFDDLEGQFHEQHVAELEAEVADRTRRERAQVALLDRLRAQPGAVTVTLLSGAPVVGTVTDVGADWCVLEDPSGRQWLVPRAAIAEVGDLSRQALAIGGVVDRMIRFGFPLRALARDRVVVAVYDVRGRVLTGTIDAVGSDHLELSEHPADVPRRAANVTAVRVLPFSAIVAVRSA